MINVLTDELLFKKLSKVFVSNPQESFTDRMSRVVGVILSHIHGPGDENIDPPAVTETVFLVGDLMGIRNEICFGSLVAYKSDTSSPNIVLFVPNIPFLSPRATGIVARSKLSGGLIDSRSFSPDSGRLVVLSDSPENKGGCDVLWFEGDPQSTTSLWQAAFDSLRRDKVNQFVDYWLPK
ncbi:MAG: hypothetical protein ABIJ46_02650 [bacterium]